MAKECTATIQSTRDVAGSHEALKMVLSTLGLNMEVDTCSPDGFYVVAKSSTSFTKNAWAQTATIKSQCMRQLQEREQTYK